MSYVSFAGLIEPFADHPFAALHGVSEGFPNVVIAEIERNLWLIDWDDLTTRQRMELAMQHDIYHDPAMEPEWTHFSNIFDLIDDKKDEIAKWQAMPEPLPSEALAKEQRLHALREELATIEARFKEPYPALPVADTATSAPVVAIGVSVTREQRQDHRLQACEDHGLTMPTSYLSRLPDGVGTVADREGVTRQAFSTDVKAALMRRESDRREGRAVHRS